MYRADFNLKPTGNYIGQVIVIACVVLQASVFRHMFFGVPGKVYGVIVTLPLLSSFLGYILAHSFKKTVPETKAIAIDCGLQNVNRALAMVSRSFDSEAQRNTILIPWLYAFITTSSYVAISVVYQIYKQYLQQRSKKENGFNLTCVGQTAV
ncbi:unnamed protein product [Larinioides sclopetarius]|uniref:Uncharacterized protein n=1 Tax=Larinioides sclopetarius TaxID=280406 RepID=A0AAV2BAI2_9ARAC